MSKPDLLDVLLAEHAPPPLPAGLAGRVAAAALSLAQAASLPGAAPRAGRHDRRGRWLRRPLVAGGVALGLAFSGAVAATFAGVEVALPDKVQTVLAEVPFFGRMAKAEPPAQPTALPPTRERRQASPDVQPSAAVAEADPDPLLRMQRARAVRHWLRARQIVAERRAAGLPTPRADRIERAIEERLVRQGVLPQDPTERAAVRDAARQEWRERAEARRAGRRAQFEAQGGMPPHLDRDEAAGAPGDAAMPDRAQMRRDRFQRMRMMRAMRLERMRQWRERRGAMQSPEQPAVEPLEQNQPLDGEGDPQLHAGGSERLLRLIAKKP